MPELPEVETTRRGLELFLVGQTVRTVVVRESRLRWPIPSALLRELPGQAIQSVTRRGKYLLLQAAAGSVILHLGMSGSLRIVAETIAPEKFDHVDIVFNSGDCLRLRDPRRFGALLWTADPAQHKLLVHLGPEPLGDNFNGDYLYRKSRARTRAIKDFLMDSRIIAGIGNIYANESLFLAGIDPRRAAGKISRARYENLSQAVRTILEQAIQAGGTTLRDFRGSDGRPGYFQQTLAVYGRRDLPCRNCGRPIRSQTLGSRSTFFCRYCQS
ncbi:MAG TPA: bifunctional DNA-formamidopyrimidine glycosylase/DNA-(apurinic or apyrimidinic site) lyase [Acidiferrobacterales bacterium]|nr:bifunctional DNA-formamidopyrimidine glycosylase/DNA-(apurinic or apyrimidinic site) lyase [Acidiferrobacterales bacterium]